MTLPKICSCSIGGLKYNPLFVIRTSKRESGSQLIAKFKIHNRGLAILAGDIIFSGGELFMEQLNQAMNNYSAYR